MAAGRKAGLAMSEKTVQPRGISPQAKQVIGVAIKIIEYRVFVSSLKYYTVLYNN